MYAFTELFHLFVSRKKIIRGDCTILSGRRQRLINCHQMPLHNTPTIRSRQPDSRYEAVAIPAAWRLRCFRVVAYNRPEEDYLSFSWDGNVSGVVYVSFKGMQECNLQIPPKNAWFEAVRFCSHEFLFLKKKLTFPNLGRNSWGLFRS